MKLKSTLSQRQARISAALLLTALGVYIAATEGYLTNLHAGAVSGAIAAAIIHPADRRRGILDGTLMVFSRILFIAPSTILSLMRWLTHC